MGLAQKSAITYANYFTEFRGLGFPVEKITIPLIDELKKHLKTEGRAHATINRCLSSIKTVLNHCKDHGLISLRFLNGKNLRK